MRKNLILKFLIVALVLLATFGIVNVGATGYTYDHKGKVIYSTEGFTVNQTPYIYETLGIEAKTFSDANPSDLFVYKGVDMGAADEAIGDTLVYLLDSGGTSKTSTLYVFNSGLKLQREIAYLRYNPATLVANGSDLTMIKSSGKLVVRSKHTVKFVDGIDESELDSQQVDDSSAAVAPFPEDHDGYYFTGWSADFSRITEDVTIKSTYEKVVEEGDDKTEVVTVTYKDGNSSSEIGSITILKGAVAPVPTAPTHEGYGFSGWDKKVDEAIKADTTVTASYKKYFTVTFMDGTDDSEIAKVKVLSGNTVEAPILPFHEGKIFKEWDAELANITANATITGTYEDCAEAITVTFKDSEGNEIAKINVRPGEDVVAPKAPVIEHQTFASWDKPLENITEPVTITAKYTKQDNGLSLVQLEAQTDMVLYMNGASCVYRGIASNSFPHTDYLYIADQANNQILVIDAKSYEEFTDQPGKGTYEIKQIITSPVSEIGTEVSFKPKKCVNDAAGRVYCICEGIGDGILEFSKMGTFDRYVGTNYVTLSAWEIFTRNFATEAQLDKFTSYQNTTFTAMVYKNNMIYTTSYAISTNDKIMIKKINPSGKDVLRRNGYNIPKGDLTYTQYNDDSGAYGASQFVGITVNDYGVYTVVDNKRGRLFTYDNEGNLLYISGGTGAQLDKIIIPIAVQYLGDNILVLDQKRKSIIVFEPTDIAKVINKAIECEYNGLNDEAYEYWTQVIQLNANYEYAYVGIGKHYMEAGEYQKAMENFKLGANPIYYSKAYKQYRDTKIKAWFPYVASGLIILIVGGAIFKRVRRKKLGIKEEEMTGMGDE